jgi:hypothetical protein
MICNLTGIATRRALGQHDPRFGQQDGALLAVLIRAAGLAEHAPRRLEAGTTAQDLIRRHVTKAEAALRQAGVRRSQARHCRKEQGQDA